MDWTATVEAGHLPAEFNGIRKLIASAQYARPVKSLEIAGKVVSNLGPLSNYVRAFDDIDQSVFYQQLDAFDSDNREAWPAIAKSIFAPIDAQLEKIQTKTTIALQFYSINAVMLLEALENTKVLWQLFLGWSNVRNLENLDNESGKAYVRQLLVILLNFLKSGPYVDTKSLLATNTAKIEKTYPGVVKADANWICENVGWLENTVNTIEQLQANWFNTFFMYLTPVCVRLLMPVLTTDTETGFFQNPTAELARLYEIRDKLSSAQKESNQKLSDAVVSFATQLRHQLSVDPIENIRRGGKLFSQLLDDEKDVDEQLLDDFSENATGYKFNEFLQMLSTQSALVYLANVKSFAAVDDEQVTVIENGIPEEFQQYSPDEIDEKEIEQDTAVINTGKIAEIRKRVDKVLDEYEMLQREFTKLTRIVNDTDVGEILAKQYRVDRNETLLLSHPGVVAQTKKIYLDAAADKMKLKLYAARLDRLISAIEKKKIRKQRQKWGLLVIILILLGAGLLWKFWGHIPTIERIWPEKLPEDPAYDIPPPQVDVTPVDTFVDTVNYYIGPALRGIDLRAVYHPIAGSFNLLPNCTTYLLNLVRKKGPPILRGATLPTPTEITDYWNLKRVLSPDTPEYVPYRIIAGIHVVGDIMIYGAPLYWLAQGLHIGLDIAVDKWHGKDEETAAKPHLQKIITVSKNAAVGLAIGWVVPTATLWAYRATLAMTGMSIAIPSIGLPVASGIFSFLINLTKLPTDQQDVVEALKEAVQTVKDLPQRSINQVADNNFYRKLKHSKQQTVRLIRTAAEAVNLQITAQNKLAIMGIISPNVTQQAVNFAGVLKAEEKKETEIFEEEEDDEAWA